MYNLRVAVKVIVFILTIQGFLCLKNVHVIVPEAVEQGTRVQMKCLYDLENQELYTVKWYRGDREFCRYSPRDVPPLKLFPIPGIEVDRDESDAERITIAAATQTANGRYTCEVSADAPSFHTAQVHTHMYVVVLPKQGPSMFGLKHRYRPGNTLKVECASYNSLPPANLSFFINSEPALKQHVTHRVDGKSPFGPMSAYSTIQFTVQKHHFIEGKLRIRCTAIIYSIYLKSYEKSAEQERIRTTPATLAKMQEAIVYSRHRIPPTNTSAAYKVTATKLGTIILFTHFLPIVLR